MNYTCLAIVVIEEIGRTLIVAFGFICVENVVAFRFGTGGIAYVFIAIAVLAGGYALSGVLAVYEEVSGDGGTAIDAFSLVFCLVEEKRTMLNA